MAMSANVRITGVKKTINTLHKMDRELSQEFRARVNQIAQPVLEDLTTAYSRANLPLSQMAYNWTAKNRAGTGRKVFPFVPSKVSGSVKQKFDTRRNSIGVVAFVQMNPGGAIFEVAGRKNHNRLAASLNLYAAERGWSINKPSRILGPTVYRSARGRGVTGEIVDLVAAVSTRMTMDLKAV
jgi:hypothetical protein